MLKIIRYGFSGKCGSYFMDNRIACDIIIYDTVFHVILEPILDNPPSMFTVLMDITFTVKFPVSVGFETHRDKSIIISAVIAILLKVSHIRSIERFERLRFLTVRYVHSLDIPTVIVMIIDVSVKELDILVLVIYVIDKSLIDTFTDNMKEIVILQHTKFKIKLVQDLPSTKIFRVKLNGPEILVAVTVQIDNILEILIGEVDAFLCDFLQFLRISFGCFNRINGRSFLHLITISLNTRLINIIDEFTEYHFRFLTFRNSLPFLPCLSLSCFLIDTRHYYGFHRYSEIIKQMQISDIDEMIGHYIKYVTCILQLIPYFLKKVAVVVQRTEINLRTSVTLGVFLHTVNDYMP